MIDGLASPDNSDVLHDLNISDNSNDLYALDDLDFLAGVVILAGGASRRMGTAKAALTLPNGEILLNYHVRQAIDLNVPIMIADNSRGFTVTPELLSYRLKSPIFHITDYGSTATTDGNDTGGALVAIESAMQALVKQPLANVTDASTLKNNAPSKKRSSWLMVISCDSLIPATELWQTLRPHTRILTHNDKEEAQQANQVPDKKVICLTDETHLYPLLGLYHLSIEPDLMAYIGSGERRVIKFIEPFLQTVPLSKKWAHLTNFNTPEDFQRAYAALNNV
ncbi:molybdopterin-guanine dinucleotide biosynthesis protein A [Psychrobacter sp. PL19]|uniref:molybdenum cofactor guanylyltransferase n=1 Tax=Psychrobacter sp. PL19 TaxID=2760711 RepID=UPI001AE53669